MDSFENRESVPSEAAVSAAGVASAAAPATVDGPSAAIPGAKYRSKAVRLAHRLRHDIRTGDGHHFGVLLPEGELARRYHVSRLTLRRTLDLLVKDGFLRRIPRRGPVVPDPGADPAPSGVPAAPPAGVVAAHGGIDGPGAGGPPRLAAGPSGARGPAGPAAGRKALQFAVLMASSPDETLEGLKDGIRAFVQGHGFGMHLVLGDDDPETAWTRLDAVRELGMDGLVVLPYPGPSRAAALRRLAAEGLPVVEVERRCGEEEAFCVEPDSAGGMYRATHYLLEQYRRPVHFLGMTPEHQADADRLTGYRLAMRDAGLDDAAIDGRTWLHEKGSGHPDWWTDARKWLPGYELAGRLFDAGPGPWSVACVKDYVAWGVYRAAAERGLGIGPEGDVTVVGFDNLMIARRLDPGLTTVAQPIFNKGHQAAALLHRLIAERLTKPLTMALPVELVIRGSA